MADIWQYRLETIIFALVLCTSAGAEEMKLQVNAPTNSRPQSSRPENNLITTPSAPASGPPTGQPIVYPMNSIPVAPANSHSDAEAQALMNAFGLILRSMGGGANNGYGMYGGRSEIASSYGDSGGISAGGSGGSLTPVGPSELSGPRKIIPPFQKWFGTCTKNLGLGDCRFENMGIMGDAAHRARRSCHNSGQAIDVGTVTCSGGQKLTTDSAQYFNLANCMANDSNNELQVIFYKASGPNMIQKSDHNKHMHIQLKNCAMVYGS